jgi:hypothetical protein
MGAAGGNVMEKKLLQCPFCGKNVEYHEAQGHYSVRPDWWGSCPDYDCPGYHSEPEGQWHTEEDARAAWMKRA